MSSSMTTDTRIPPGFRFHPTDEELVDYYLRKKVESKSIDLDVIHEVDLYKIEPWDLSGKCQIGSTEQNEWYFFSHKDKKYPTGTRANRSTTAGFWKATGRDKAIYTKQNLVGMRKTLVFYRGRAPNGQKTDWIMHEYRLQNSETAYSQEEGWVVCRAFRKKCPAGSGIGKFYERDPSSSYAYTEQHMLHSVPDFGPFLHFPPEDNLYNNLVLCKQEVELHFPTTSNNSFIQMPSLESPTTAYGPHYPDIRKLLEESDRCQELPSNSPLEPLRSYNSNHGKQQVLTDWRELDQLVASQLSPPGNTSKSVIAPVGEITIHQQESFSQHNECHNVNDADLWIFTGRNLQKH